MNGERGAERKGKKKREGMRKEVRGKSKRKMLKKMKLCNYLVRKKDCNK